jgi:hypothetical protein
MDGVPYDARDMKGSLEFPPPLSDKGEEHITGNAQGSQVAEFVWKTNVVHSSPGYLE